MIAGNALAPGELERFAGELAESPELWRPHVRHLPESRLYERIWDDKLVNAWVICWSAGHDTGFHDHDTSAAALTVVRGEIREERLRLAASPRSRVVGTGATLSVPAHAIHRVGHAGVGPAVSIHAYSPPLRRTGAYSVGRDGELERIGQACERELRELGPVS